MSASSVAAGREHTVVLTREGDVYSWGDDGGGQLGGGERSSDAADAFARPTPAKVASFPRG
jgi:alpha-tubulin suppressor-like RCC1 family protein